MNKEIKLDNYVTHSDFGPGQVVQLNMSGPVVKFEKYENVMCCPEFSLIKVNKNKILILDIETSGFLNAGGSIVEIGIVELNLENGEIEDVFDSLVREEIFSMKHTEGRYGWIFKNSDLTPEDVFGAPMETEVFPKVQKILDSYPLGCTAYNNKFDFGFLEDRGISIKKLPCPMILSTDICKIKGKNKRNKWPKVEEAFSFFFPEIKYTEQHRGLDDSKHEAMIVYKLYQDGVFKVGKS